MPTIAIELDLPQGAKFISYERVDDAHAIEVDWDAPENCSCPQCKHSCPTQLETRSTARTLRDLFIFGLPTLLVYQPAFHRCPECGFRQELIPCFKRKDVSYTFRFEELVVQMLIGSTEEDVGRRLGISAETVCTIVKNQLSDVKLIDPKRKILHIGMDELSLKKRHKLYATLMTDLSDPSQPKILAIAKGKDEAAALECLNRLTEEQRAQVKTHRVDMGKSYTAACPKMLPKSRQIIDRFHVAKKFNENVDKARKKITKKYKATLTKKELKEFKSQMWHFRRDPATLTVREKCRLSQLFGKIPELKVLYEYRLEFKRIFDTAEDREEASRRLKDLRKSMKESGLELDEFWGTYDNWETGILNYFDDGHTSATVEGVNNKARVIIKRCYGVRTVGTLWNRMVLDMDLSALAVGKTIKEMRGLTAKIRKIFQ